MLFNIEVLRALAAMLVVVVHCEVALAPLGITHSDLNAFGTGVDLFFIISGFIMVYNTGRRHQTVPEFAKSRIARLVPLYWFLTLATFAIALAAPTLLSGTRAETEALVKSLLFIPYERSDHTVRPILFVGWSLNYEMFFYLLFACGLLLRGTVARVVLVSAMLLGMVALGFTEFAQHSIPAKFFTRPVLLEFILGMILGLVYNRLPDRISFAYGAGIIALVCFAAQIVVGHNVTSIWPFAGLPAAGLVAAMLVMERGGLALRWRPLLMIGDASFALYLVHPFVAQFLTKLAQARNLVSPATATPLVLLIFVASVAVAICVRIWIERPAGKLARRALDTVWDTPRLQKVS